MAGTGKKVKTNSQLGYLTLGAQGNELDTKSQLTAMLWVSLFCVLLRLYFTGIFHLQHCYCPLTDSPVQVHPHDYIGKPASA